MIRDATGEDYARLVELMSMAAFPPNHDVTDEDLAMPHVRRWFGTSAGDSLDLVHVTGDTVEGAVWARVVEPVLWTIDGVPVPEVAIAVSPTARGRGVGAALLVALHQRAG